MESVKAAKNFLPWTHVPNQIALNTGVNQTPTQTIPAQSTPSAEARTVAPESRSVKALRAGWMQMKAQIFAGKYHTPDAENPDIVNHLDWYEATGFTLPYPGETKVLPASAFKKAVNSKAADDDR
jgi:hypothetical protein